MAHTPTTMRRPLSTRRRGAVGDVFAAMIFKWREILKRRRATRAPPTQSHFWGAHYGDGSGGSGGGGGGGDDDGSDDKDEDDGDRGRPRRIGARDGGERP